MYTHTPKEADPKKKQGRVEFSNTIDGSFTLTYLSQYLFLCFFPQYININKFTNLRSPYYIGFVFVLVTEINLLHCHLGYSKIKFVILDPLVYKLLVYVSYLIFLDPLAQWWIPMQPLLHSPVTYTQYLICCHKFL